MARVNLYELKLARDIDRDFYAEYERLNRSNMTAYKRNQHNHEHYRKWIKNKIDHFKVVFLEVYEYNDMEMNKPLTKHQHALFYEWLKSLEFDNFNNNPKL